jgi:hypothetical protein
MWFKPIDELTKEMDQDLEKALKFIVFTCGSVFFVVIGVLQFLPRSI